MDVSIIASSIVSLLTPYFLKTGEKIAEKFGEEIFPSIKRLFIEEDDKKLISNVEESPNSEHLQAFEDKLKIKLESHPDFKMQISKEIGLTEINAVQISKLIETLKGIQENIDNYGEMLINAGIGSSGDLQVILQNELIKHKRILKQIQSLLK